MSESGEICDKCGDYLVCHYCLRKPLLEELSTLRAKLKLAEAVVEAAREYVNRKYPVSWVKEKELIETIRAYDEAGPQAPKEEA